MKEITEELLTLAAKGNQYAIEDLYNLTYNSVYKTAKILIQDEDTVLDIIQDSYIKAFQSLDQLDSPENFRAWIRKIAANKAKDYLKKKKPILFSEMVKEAETDIDFLDERLDHYPELVMERKETARLIKKILDTLSEDQRLIIGMFYYEQMSVKEIAESLNCSENTVKSRLNYGRKKVETKVRELEKKGTKLYSLAPLPFLLSLFATEASAEEVPSASVLEGITAKCTAGATGTSGAGTKTAVRSGAKAATGAKALTIKIAAGLLAASVIGGGAMLALSSHDREETEPIQQSVATESTVAIETTLATVPETTVPETTAATVPVVTAEEAYQAITAEYRAVLGADSAAFLMATDGYFNADHVSIRYYHMHHADNFYYARQDIDGNGTEELLIGFGPEGYIKIVDLYSFDGEQAVQLIDEPTLGDRSSLSLLEDNTLYLFGGSSATEASHTYLNVEGCTVVDAPVSDAEEMMIPWQPIDQVEIPVSGTFPDSILTDIQTALMINVADYDANMESYDQQYSHLGEGVLWMLLHREVGDYTMSIWNADLDADGDGQNELCIGRGVSPGSTAPIVIYRQTGEVIYGDAIYDYMDLIYSVPVEWNYLGG